ncbi:MAG: hypothetical protein Q7J38_02265 [Gallionella sp.]|nr:hypothetical protein [Gallionella sp.]
MPRIFDNISAGWNIDTQVREKVHFTDGRIYVRGRIHTRGERKRADYILYYKPNIPIAIIEAKDNNHSVSSGIQQALGYAVTLDYPHLKKVESRAQKANWFVVRQQKADCAYVFHKQHGFDALLGKTAQALGERATEVDALINLLLPLNTRQAEIVATLYAAWNNLLLLGRSPGDEDVVYEARENWHTSKLEIAREKFFRGLEWMRKQGLVPLVCGCKITSTASPRPSLPTSSPPSRWSPNLSNWRPQHLPRC